MIIKVRLEPLPKNMKFLAFNTVYLPDNPGYTDLSGRRVSIYHSPYVHTLQLIVSEAVINDLV
jgi:hypothetical protein